LPWAAWTAAPRCGTCKTSTNQWRSGRHWSAPTAQLEALAFSPGGDLLAAGSDDHTVWVWNVADPHAPRWLATLTQPTGQVVGLAFSPRGHLLAAASSDHDTYLWDTSNPARPRPLPTLTGPINYAYSVAFSPDGRTLAVGSADKSVRPWDLADPDHPHRLGQPLTGPTNYIYSVAFSPDSSVWLWNVTKPTAPDIMGTLHASGAVFSVAFSPDGLTLAAGTADRTARLWQLDPKQVAAAICDTAGDPITRAEWRQYVSDLPYAPPCPNHR
jgi:WD40 repeat protein